jgi:large subunit ribosomal protein L29
MRFEELKQKSKEELEKTLEDSKDKLRQLRFDLGAGKIKNVREIRKTKKEIAQILTLLRNYEKGTKIRKDSE